jgi:predicted negative regulator of RcsB-dependent stress response
MKSTSIPFLCTVLATFLFFSKVVTAPTAQPAVPTTEESLVAIKDVLAAWTGYEKLAIISLFIEGILAILGWWYWDRTSNSKIAVALNKLVDIQTKTAASAAGIAVAFNKLADSQNKMAEALATLATSQNKMAEALATLATQVDIAVRATGEDTSNTADNHDKNRSPNRVD